MKKNGVASDRLRVENGLRLSKMVLAQYIGIGEDDFEIDFTLPAEVPSPELSTSRIISSKYISRIAGSVSLRPIREDSLR